MTEDTKEAIQFASAAAAIAAILLSFTSCAAKMENETTKRTVACVQAGKQVVSSNCVNG